MRLNLPTLDRLLLQAEPEIPPVGEELGATQRHVRSFRDLYSECLYCTVFRQLASPLRVSADVVLRNGLRTGAAARAGVLAACNNRAAVSVLSSPD